MTAFDNIKANNWPSTFNEFEDFLVLKMPLNDLASLTESTPVVAGSKVLFPKRTLTNTGVAVLEAGDVIYSSGLSSTNGLAAGNPGKNAFDGSLSTYAQSNLSSDNSINVDFSSNPISYSSSVRIYCYAANGYDITNTYYLNSSASGTTFTGGAANFNGAAWITVASGSGTLSHLRLRLERGGGNNSAAGLYAIEVDGTILTEPAGGSKKHYANNVHFGLHKYISIPQDSKFDLGTEPFTLECYVKTSDTTTGYPIIIGRWGSGGDSNFSNKWDWRPRAADNGGRWCFRVPDSGGTSGIIDGGEAVTDGAWHHIAVSRSGNTWRMFTDGQLTNTVTNSNPIPALDGPLNLARGYHTFNGYIQDLRFYKGVGKYTANFIPPSAILG